MSAKFIFFSSFYVAPQFSSQQWPVECFSCCLSDSTFCYISLTFSTLSQEKELSVLPSGISLCPPDSLFHLLGSWFHHLSHSFFMQGSMFVTSLSTCFLPIKHRDPTVFFYFTLCLFQSKWQYFLLIQILKNIVALPYMTGSYTYVCARVCSIR